jgi:hypothetical protein
MFERFKEIIAAIAHDGAFGSPPLAEHGPALLVCAALLVVAERLDLIGQHLQDALEPRDGERR